MASVLNQLQWKFARLIPKLLDKAFELGYEISLGDAYRDPRAFGMLGVTKAYGHPKSAHKRRLAIDLNLFKDGTFMDESEAHRQLGEWWEAQDSMCRWGGRWGDGNHYSMEFDGVR